MSETLEQHDESSLSFDYNGLATWPLWLHYTRVLDFYTGDALQADGHFRRFSRHLFVPPNVAAVILCSPLTHRGEAHGLAAREDGVPDENFRVLPPGRYHIGGVMNGAWPVSAQFVRLDALSFAMEKLLVPTEDHLYFEIDLWVTLKVTDPRRIIQLREPIDDVRSAFRQRLTKRLRTLTHDEGVQILPTLVEVDIAQEVAEEFRHHGLEVKVGLNRLKPDGTWEDLQRRAATVQKDNEVQRREAQRDEDVFAIKQPSVRRMASVNIAAQTRERNQQARMEAIDSVKELARALVEDLRLHPGRVYTEKDMQPLVKALELLDKLAQPVSPPQFPTQVRSYFALDATGDPKTAVPAPPELPQDLPVPPGSVWDKGQSG